jgi:hypothetical protein
MYIIEMIMMRMTYYNNAKDIEMHEVDGRTKRCMK